MLVCDNRSLTGNALFNKSCAFVFARRSFSKSTSGKRLPIFIKILESSPRQPKAPQKSPRASQGGPWGFLGSPWDVHRAPWDAMGGPWGTLEGPILVPWDGLEGPWEAERAPEQTQRRRSGEQYINKLPINRPSGRYVTYCLDSESGRYAQ